MHRHTPIRSVTSVAQYSLRHLSHVTTCITFKPSMQIENDTSGTPTLTSTQHPKDNSQRDEYHSKNPSMSSPWTVNPSKWARRAQKDKI